MTQTTPTSPYQLAAQSRAAFDSRYRQTCACQPLELREASAGRLECAWCGAPISRRRRSAP